MAFQAKYDGKCEKCGGVILGKFGSAPTNPMHISWPRRGTLRNAAGKKIVYHDNPTCSQVAAGIMIPVTGATPAPVATPSAPVAAATPTPATSGTAEKIIAALKAAGVSIPATVAAATVAATSTTKAKISGWWDVLVGLIQSGCHRVILLGPAGTGKSTTSAKNIAEMTGKKVYRITITPGTTEEELKGMYQLIPSPSGSGTITQWVDGPAVCAMREGAILQLDECCDAPPEIEGLFYCLWDDAPELTLPTGEVVRAAEGYTVIGTTNEPVNVLRPALLNRLEGILIANAPHPDALKDLDAATKAACVNYYRGVKPDAWKFARSPEVRPVRAFNRLRAAGLLPDDVLAKAIFGDSASEFLSAISTSAMSAKGVR